MVNYIVLFCLLAVAAANPILPLGPAGPALPIATFDSMSIPKYSFNYAVSDPHTGDNKAQTEYREGGVVKGSYSVSEPDGTLRVVDYSADPIRGFNADVKRLGHAGHPGAIIASTPIAHLAPIAPIAPIAYAKPLTWAPAYSAINVATGHLGFDFPYAGALWHH